MPWPKSPPTPTPNPAVQPPAAVPHSDTVRRAALSASWVRDHQAARRRLALRWLLWAWWRIGLPLVLALLLALAFIVWLLRQAPPTSVPAWLKPLVASVQLTAPSGSGTPPAATSPPSKNAPHGKEP